MEKTLSRFADTTYEELPRNVRLQTKLCLLDTMAAIIGGSLTYSSSIAREFACYFKSPEEATVFGNTRKAPSIFAAYSNSVMASDVDADDGHRGAMGHPGSAVVPASLAIGEMQRLNGKTLLEGIAIGYEIGIRLGMIVNKNSKTCFRGSGSWVSYGVTAAASKLMEMPETKFLAALGICEAYTPMAPMNWMFSGRFAMTKEASGWGALTGISAALLAGRGMTGNFTMINEDNREILSTLGTRWEIANIYFKDYSSCRYTHPAIDAILKLKSKHHFRVEDILSISVETFRFGSGLTSFEPQNSYEAQYSIPFTSSVALLYGQVGPAEMSEENLKNEKILHLAEKVQVVVNNEMENAFPKQTISQVEIKLRNKLSLKARSNATCENIQPRAVEKRIKEKLFTYIKNYLPDKEIDSLISIFDEVDTLDDVSILVGKIQKAVRRCILARGEINRNENGHGPKAASNCNKC